MIKTQTCYTVHCDGTDGDGKPCQSRVEHDYEPHWPTAFEARDEATDNFEWWTDGTTDLCERCKESPHDFTPEAGQQFGDCARCGLDAELHPYTHEPAPTL